MKKFNVYGISITIEKDIDDKVLGLITLSDTLDINAFECEATDEDDIDEDFIIDWLKLENGNWDSI